MVVRITKNLTPGTKEREIMSTSIIKVLVSSAVVLAVQGCGDPMVEGFQVIRVAVRDSATEAPAVGCAISCAPLDDMTTSGLRSKEEYLRVSGTPSVVTDDKGEVDIKIKHYDIAFKLRDLVTGHFYLFRVDNSTKEVLSVFMHPGLKENGCHYRVTIVSIGEPIQTYSSLDSLFGRKHHEISDATRPEESQ